MNRSQGAKGRSWLLLFLCGVVLLLSVLCKGACNFPAIFNFGDSSSDTGTLHFIFPDNIEAENPPYGRTFFGHPAQSYSDGRVSIDFFASALGLPFLIPYTQSVGANFAHGANFAVPGATVQDVSFIAPISLPVQVNQFKVFKQQVLAAVKDVRNIKPNHLTPSVLRCHTDNLTPTPYRRTDSINSAPRHVSPN